MFEVLWERGNLGMKWQGQLGSASWPGHFTEGSWGGSVPRASVRSAVPRLTQDHTGSFRSFWESLDLFGYA